MITLPLTFISTRRVYATFLIRSSIPITYLLCTLPNPPFPTTFSFENFFIDSYYDLFIDADPLVYNDF